MDRSTLEEEKLKYLKKLTSQEKIAKAALNDCEWRVKSEAVKKLTDEVALKKVAINDTVVAICSAAVEKITNETYLCEVGKCAKLSDIRSKAVRKITYEPVLEEIVLTDGNQYVRICASNGIKDEERLLNIVEKTDDELVAYEIVHRLSKESLAKVKSDNWFITEIVEDLLSK